MTTSVSIDQALNFPGKRYKDWVLDDPAGQGIDAARPIRDDIRARIGTLVADSRCPSMTCDRPGSGLSVGVGH